MKHALAEMKKGVVEQTDHDSQQKLWYLSMVSIKVDSLIEERFAALRASDTPRWGLGLPPLANPIDKEVKVAHSRLGKPLADRNPEIGKYLKTVKTDPAYDGGKSGPVDTTIMNNGGDWQVTAWCAAFVNWCLKQAGHPHLGYATARSWLDFGTPLPFPEFGAVIVIKPEKSTGSTTGHVAFFERQEGDWLTLIGGNQSKPGTRSSDRVNRMQAHRDQVEGIRWPTAFNYLLLDRRSRLV